MPASPVSTPWSTRLDRVLAISGALLPAAIVSGSALLEGILALVGIIWLSRCLLFRDNPIPRLLRHPLPVAWLAWYGTILLSLAINGGGLRDWGHDLAYIRQLLYLAAMLDVSQRQPVGRYLLFGLGASILWAGLNTLVAITIGHDLVGRAAFRYTGKLKEAGRISGLAAYATPFFWAWTFWGQSSRQRKILAGGLGIIATILLCYIGIRTAILAAVCGLTFCWAGLERGGRWKYPVLLIGLLVLATAAWQLMPDEKFYSLYDRVHIWKVGIDMWLAHPLVGGTISAFEKNFTSMATNGGQYAVISATGEVFAATTASHLHNQFLMALATTGIVGFAAFCSLIFLAIKAIHGQQQRSCIPLMTWPPAFLSITVLGWNIYGGWYQALLVFWITLIALLTTDSVASSPQQQL